MLAKPMKRRILMKEQIRQDFRDKLRAIDKAGGRLENGYLKRVEDAMLETIEDVLAEAESQSDLSTMILKDNKRMRDAGCKLSEAALYVAREYDGVHRLMLTVSEWAKVVANESGRGEK